MEFTGDYDVGVVSHAADPLLGSQSLRISNAIVSTGFGDWAYSKALTDAVGEIDATSGGYPTGTLQTHFVAEFDIASTVPDAQQPDLSISVSPDRGDGSRMSYLSFTDGTDGIDVTFYDVEGPDSPCTPAGCADFVGTQIAAGLDRSVPHHIKLSLDTVDGKSNDTVKVYIDGNLVHTGTSWENYFRFDPEANAEQSPRIVDRLLFIARGAHNPNAQYDYPALAGKGFLIDNIALSSSTRLVNGSFEDGASSDYAYVPGGSSDVTGWTTTQHGVEWFNPGF